MDKSLNGYIEAIRAIPIDDSLSDDAVVTLSKIHLSILTMLVANGLEEEYGGESLHREAMERLFAISRKRSRSNQSLSRRSRMIPVLYDCFCMPDSVSDARRYDLCMRRSFRVAEEWQAQPVCARPEAGKARMVEYDVLQSILDAFVSVVGEIRETDKDFCFLKRRVEAWGSELGTEGCWLDLPAYEAARRLDLMVGHSNANEDRRFDARIGTALDRYAEAFLRKSESPADGRTLFYLYRALSEAQRSPGRRKAEAMAGCAARRCDAYPSGSDAWLWHLSVVIDSACEEINRLTKRRLLAFSA